MAVNSKFVFVGELVLPRDISSFYNEAEDGSRVSIGFSVAEGEKNKGWVEATGFKNKTIKVRNKDGNQIEFDWDDRLDPLVVSEVAGGAKFYVNLGDDFGGQKEFVSKYDMVKFLAEQLQNYSGKVKVKGIWEKNPWKGKISNRFSITSVYAAKPDEVSALTLEAALFYNTECVDQSDFKDNQKIYVNGYVEQYVRAEGKRMLFPQQMVMSQAAYRMDDPAHAAKWNKKVSYLKEELPKRKKYAHLLWNCRLVNGAEEVPFDESMLTDAQREMIECGLSTIDEFKPKSRVYGPKLTEIRMVKPSLSGAYADGPVECEESNGEIEARIFTFEKEESLEEVLKEDILKAPAVEQPTDDDADDLF